MTDIPVEQLITTAQNMMNFSYAPYSHFTVGAALLATDGSIYTGCNIENAAYGPSNCAERTAVFKAVSEGCRDFEAIAIAGDAEYCSPCGVCRQVLSEFCDKDFKVILTDCRGGIKTYTLGELLPLSFSL